jgi:7-carboxy-7-deazaguanine synthase
MKQSSIKVSEQFFSLQGEGLHAGIPSVFLRTFGCNFRCPSFGLPLGEKTNTPLTIQANLAQYARYEDLPLVQYGCDSYAAVYPGFKSLSPTLSVSEIADKLHSIIPHNTWSSKFNDIHLVITGGEPLLGWQRAYPELINLLRKNGLGNITFETNGTQELTNEFTEYLFNDFTRFGRDYNKLTFSVSPKLPCSGELWEDAIKPSIVKGYEMVGLTYLKFVVATEVDVTHAEKAVAEYRSVGFAGPVYLMPIGGITEQYQLNARQVASMAMARGWRYSPRLQCDLFKNEWGT